MSRRQERNSGKEERIGEYRSEVLFAKENKLSQTKPAFMVETRAELNICSVLLREERKLMARASTSSLAPKDSKGPDSFFPNSDP